MTDEFNLLRTQRHVFESNLDTGTKIVALALLDHWSRTTETFPSVARLAVWTSLGRSTVMRGLAKLERLGAIVVTRRNGISNRYDLGQMSLLPVSLVDRSISDTGLSVTPVPVSPVDRTSLTMTPEGTHEGIQQGTHLAEQAPNERTNGVRKTKRRQQAETSLPADWQPTEQHRAYALKHRLQLDLEVDSFRGWAEGRTTVSWNGTFATRLANQAKWNGQRGNGAGKAVVQRGGEIRETKHF